MTKKDPESEYQEFEASGFGYLRNCLIQSCAIDDTRVNDSMLKVLVALGSYASRKNSNWCWAKEVSIANRLGVSRQMVSRAANALAKCGYIEIRHAFREDGGQISSSYRILLDFELEDEYRRDPNYRARAGIGGRKKRAPINSELPPPLNSEFTGAQLNAVAGGATPEVAGGATPEVAGGATPEVAPLNPESENGTIKRKRKMSISHFVEKREDTSPRQLPTIEPIAEIRHPDRATPPPASAAPPPMPARDTWRMIRAEMEPVMSPVQRREWLDRLDLYYLGDDAYTLVCPTPYGVEYVEAQWGGHLRAALHHARGPDAVLSIICPKREKAHA